MAEPYATPLDQEPERPPHVSTLNQVVHTSSWSAQINECCPSANSPSSHQNSFHHLAVDIRQTILSALKLVRESLVVDAELVQNRGLKIVDVHGIFGHVESKFVARAIGNP